MGRVHGARTTPSDQPVVVSHGAGLRAGFRTTETVRGVIVASHQGPAGPLLACCIRRGIVDATQFHWIHVELDRKLVHRAFERIDVWHHRWRAHEARCISVRMYYGDTSLHRTKAVQTRAILYACH